MRCGVYLILFALFSHCAIAQPLPNPIVRASISQTEISIGEAAKLTVIVLVPTWFPKPPVFPSFEIVNALTRLPADSAYPISERIDGVSWSGITREYEIYPLIAGQFRLEGTAMTVTYANPPARTPLRASVPVPEVEFFSRAPAGASTLDPYLAGNTFSLARRLDGFREPLRVGDSFVISYEAQLQGLPSMFLPRLTPELEQSGLRIYARQPILADGSSAIRSETTTVVIERQGSFVIPAKRFRWWNRSAARLESAEVPALHFSVAPGSNYAEDDKRHVNWMVAALAAAALLAAVLVGQRLAPPLLSRYRARTENRRRSEAYLFHIVVRKLKTALPSEGFEALLNWHGRLFPGNLLRDFAIAYGGPDLLQELDRLSRSLYAESGADPDIDKLVVGLKQARRYCLALSARRSSICLPDLNARVIQS